MVVEQVGEKKNEILVKENEDLDAKIAKESLLAENVYDEIDVNNHDNKAKSISFINSIHLLKFFCCINCISFQFCFVFDVLTLHTVPYVSNCNA